MIDRAVLGEKIRNFRQRAGMSQLQLEVEIEASTGSMSRIESGKINPTKETLFKISEVLNLVPEETADLFGIRLAIKKNVPYNIHNKKEGIEDAYNLIIKLDREEIAKEFEMELKELGYTSISIYLRDKKVDCFTLYRTNISTRTREIAKELLKKDIFDIEYYTADNTIISRAINSGKIQISNEIFDILIPHKGEIFSLYDSNASKSVVILPLKINSQIVGCATFQSTLLKLTVENTSKLENLADKIAKKFFAANIKAELEIDNQKSTNFLNTDNGIIRFIREFLLFENLRRLIKEDRYMQIFSIMYVACFAWWIFNQIYYEPRSFIYHLWGDIYFLMNLYSLILGFIAAKITGKNILRQMIIILMLISTGHLFGQIYFSSSYYLKSTENLYPSVADFGFLSATFLSLYLSILIYKHLRSKKVYFSINSWDYIVGVIIFIVIIYLGLFSTSQYEWTDENLKIIIFDMTYLVVQSLAVIVSFFGLLRLRRTMVSKETRFFFVLYFLSSIILYICDTFFSYLYFQDVYTGGDVTDLLYFFYYSFIAFGHVALLATIKRDAAIKMEGMELKNYRYAVDKVVRDIIK